MLNVTLSGKETRCTNDRQLATGSEKWHVRDYVYSIDVVTIALIMWGTSLAEGYLNWSLIDVSLDW